MNLIHRAIDYEQDKDYILERHCRINYECDCPWKRKSMSYDDYRDEWFSLNSQIKGFSEMLLESAKDKKTIAEIIETDNNIKVAYLWVVFNADEESGFNFADVQDIYVEEQFRNMGIAELLMKYAETKAKENGAKVIRSGTGRDNIKSFNLHDKLGYYQYRYEFEKVL